ncbi:hypothetical protein PSPO01_01884 [Paraphaeosphaeria sporulosa]
MSVYAESRVALRCKKRWSWVRFLNYGTATGIRPSTTRNEQWRRFLPRPAQLNTKAAHTSRRADVFSREALVFTRGFALGHGTYRGYLNTSSRATQLGLDGSASARAKATSPPHSSPSRNPTGMPQTGKAGATLRLCHDATELETRPTYWMQESQRHSLPEFGDENAAVLLTEGQHGK